MYVESPSTILKRHEVEAASFRQSDKRPWAYERGYCFFEGPMLEDGSWTRELVDPMWSRSRGAR